MNLKINSSQWYTTTKDFCKLKISFFLNVCGSQSLRCLEQIESKTRKYIPCHGQGVPEYSVYHGALYLNYVVCKQPCNCSTNHYLTHRFQFFFILTDAFCGCEVFSTEYADFIENGISSVPSIEPFNPPTQFGTCFPTFQRRCEKFMHWPHWQENRVLLNFVFGCLFATFSFKTHTCMLGMQPHKCRWMRLGKNKRMFVYVFICRLKCVRAQYFMA